MYINEPDEQSGQKIKMTEGRFRLAFEKAPIGMAVVDFDYSMRRVNEALCKALGYAAHELLDRKFIELTHADDIVRDCFAQKLERRRRLQISAQGCFNPGTTKVPPG